MSTTADGGMMDLNSVMEFGQVVRSDGHGNVETTDNHPNLSEVIYLQLDADGQSPDDDFLDLYRGWEPLSGFTGQYGYNGPVMHPSEYVGGGLERHIREIPGLYVCVLVDGLPTDEDAESEPIGWAVLVHETEE